MLLLQHEELESVGLEESEICARSTGWRLLITRSCTPSCHGTWYMDSPFMYTRDPFWDNGFC